MSNTKNELKQKAANQLAERLCELMDAVGISTKVLAQATGISSASVENLRTAKSEPGFTVVILLADYFAVPLDYLCGRLDEDAARQIIEDYPKYFGELRRMSYEDYITSRRTLNLDGYEAPWPYNLYEQVIQEEAQSILRDDQIAGIEKAISTLTEREQDCIYRYFRYGMAFEKIGKSYNVTQERIRQVIVKGVRKLRHPARSCLMKYGYLPELEKAEEEVAVRRREVEVATMEINAELERLDITRRKIGMIRGKLESPDVNLKEWDNERSKLPTPSGSLLLYSVDDMNLSVRSWNVLRRADITTLGEILEAEEEGRLLRLRNMGKKSHEEILDKVNAILNGGHENREAE